MKKYRVTIPEVWHRVYEVEAFDECMAMDVAAELPDTAAVEFKASHREDDECWEAEEVA